MWKDSAQKNARHKICITYGRMSQGCEEEDEAFVPEEMRAVSGRIEGWGT